MIKKAGHCLWYALALLVVLIIAAGCAAAPVAPNSPVSAATVAVSTDLIAALSSGRPTLAEFGSKTCIPCKEMKPILEGLARDYGDRINIVTVEVYEQTSLTQQNRISIIPTQVVYDASGKEFYRHIGLWPREEILSTLKKMALIQG